MELFILILLIFGVLGLFVYIFLVFNFNYWKKRGIVGPKPRPLFGNLPNVILKQQNFQLDVCDIYREFKGKEKFVGIFNIWKPQLLIIDPKVVQEVLITNFKSFNLNEWAEWIHKDLDPMIARNPFLLKGDDWKEKRAEIVPALTVNRLKACYPIMLSSCSKMTKYIEKLVEASPPEGINAKELSARYTTEVISNMVYGIEAGAFDEECPLIRRMGASIIDESFATLVYFVLMSGLPKVLKKVFKRRLVRAEVEDYFVDLIDQAIKLRKENQSDRMDILNYLLQLKEKKNLSDTEITAHSLTFFSEGFETSSILISNCLRCLAQHKDAQEKLRKEIDQAIDQSNEIPFEKLQELPYLDQCVNECLRLYPPALEINKVCTQTCQVESNKEKHVTIDEGTVIILPYYAIHHDPEYYENPDDFIPERFNEENGGIKKYKDMGVFLPFGDGPRICLGMKLGLCQSKAAIAEIVRNWDINLNPKTKPKFVVDPKMWLCLPEGGTWIDFKRITK